MEKIKNIVFDLGGVVFSRDPRKFEPEFIKFFSFIANPRMPEFWEEYDRGVITFKEVVAALAEYNSCDEELAAKNIKRSIITQEQVPPTKSLIEDLKAAGYKLYVLSNMSREFIDFLRKQKVYENFDGDVVSCEVGIVKPMPEIYDLLLKRFDLDPAETIFIDDRKENVDAAVAKGIATFHFDRNDYEGSCERLREILL